jgi:hypothetical protein
VFQPVIKITGDGCFELPERYWEGEGYPGIAFKKKVNYVPGRFIMLLYLKNIIRVSFLTNVRIKIVELYTRIFNFI